MANLISLAIHLLKRESVELLRMPIVLCFPQHHPMMMLLWMESAVGGKVFCQIMWKPLGFLMIRQGLRFRYSFHEVFLEVYDHGCVGNFIAKTLQTG
jgi:hypothetical protein